MDNIEESEQIKPKKRYHFDKILFIILLILVALFVRKYIASQSTELLPDKTEEITSIINLDDVAEDISIEDREINVDVIHHKDCFKCFATEHVLDYLIKKGLNLTIKENYIQDSEEYAELVEKLGITKLPVVVLSGNLKGLDNILTVFEKRDEYLIFEAAEPAFYYIPSKKFIGYVDLIYLKDKECKVCSKLGAFIEDMDTKMGVTFTEKKAVYPDSKEGKELIKKYNIKKVPSLIFTRELLEYSYIAKSWDKIGSIESDGALVLREITPPYKNPQTGEVEGIVDVTVLIDSSCTDCLDIAKVVEQVKTKYKLVFGISKTVDVKSEEGKELIKKYSIEKAPTFIFSDNAKLYPGLMMEWEKKLGVLAEDGKFVFTKI